MHQNCKGDKIKLSTKYSMKYHFLSILTLLSNSHVRGFATRNAANTWGKRTNTALFEQKQRMAEKVLSNNPRWPAEWPYTSQDLSRMDESEDTLFYESPRLCTHIDDAAIQALTNHYASEFKDGDDVLDICSSWISHYPKEDQWKPGNVVGLGMNEYELSKNNILNSYNVKDLNVDPTFPYDDASFDKVTCVVSVDYLTQPREVFAEIGRVLKPGGMAMIAISNRCFPTKAWNLWLRTNDLEHVFIVGSFFHFTTGVFEEPTCVDVSPNPGRSDPMFIIRGVKKDADANANADEKTNSKSIDTSTTTTTTTTSGVGNKTEEETKDIVAANSSDDDNDDDEEAKMSKRKNVMDFLKKKGAVGQVKDFSKAKGVDEGPEDKSLEDLKAIQGIKGLKKK